MWKIFKRLFCKHSYIKIGFKQEEENGIRFSIRHYKCEKCGKEIYQDARYIK